MRTIKLPDGYSDDVVECEIDPVETEGDMYKLRVAGSNYLFRWCTKQQWEEAMHEAYTEEMHESFIREHQRAGYDQMEREAKFRAWLEEE